MHFIYGVQLWSNLHQDWKIPCEITECTVVHSVVRMTQAYIGVLRKVGYRAPQPKSPIGIRSGISDYVGPGSTPENFSSTGLLCSSLAIPNMYGLCPFLVYFIFIFL